MFSYDTAKHQKECGPENPIGNKAYSLAGGKERGQI